MRCGWRFVQHLVSHLFGFIRRALPRFPSSDERKSQEACAGNKHGRARFRDRLNFYLSPPKYLRWIVSGCVRERTVNKIVKRESGPIKDCFNRKCVSLVIPKEHSASCVKANVVVGTIASAYAEVIDSSRKSPRVSDSSSNSICINESCAE